MVIFTEEMLNGKPQFSEEVVWRCSLKKIFLKISRNSQENTCARVYFLICWYSRRRQAWGLQKETLAQVFSCEFCKMFKKTFVHRTPLVAALDFLCSDEILLWDNYGKVDFIRKSKVNSKRNFKYIDSN